MTEVKRGQFWSIITNRRWRVEVKVTSISNGIVTMKGAGRMTFTMRKRALERGQRGARLVRKGQVYGAPQLDVVGLRKRLVSVRVSNELEDRKASDLVKTKPPRGIARSSEDDQAAYDLLSEGLSVSEIAKKLKITENVARGRIARVRQAKEDAALMRELRA